MLPDDSSSRSQGMLASADASKAGRSGLGGSCSHCGSLCNACKPIMCSFCEPGSGLAGAARMCEACAGNCDSCKRAACAPCAASFAACATCGYATCEDCRLQAHVSRDAAVGSAAAAAGSGGAGSGCWCAPPLRAASNVRHISSQRYQLSQLHPSVLASSMQAAGLRDAEEYDEEFKDYDDIDYDYEFNPATSSSVMNAAAAFDVLARGGCGGMDQQQRPDLQRQLDANRQQLAAAARSTTNSSSCVVAVVVVVALVLQLWWQLQLQG
ncbi:hypothetical protein COO60DRAFT_1702398 [Scenedesmus sp. NREL 46B-D3]|nr:hypothetical protein COO60DRAFT_1702398 [Scenedesmus sp. NREL 46B-D3]